MHIRWPSRFGHVFDSLAKLQTGLGLALLGLVLAGLALAGWATVARSRAALPGDSLYGVKRLSEQVTLALTQDPAAKAQRHAQLLHTRLYEIVALVIAGRYENLPAAVDELRAEIDSTAVAARALAERYQNQGVEFVAQMEQMLNDASQLLASLAQAGPLEAQPIVGRAVVAAVAGSGVLRAQLPLAANMALNDDAPPATAAPLVATVIAAVPTDTPTPTTPSPTPTAANMQPEAANRATETAIASITPSDTPTASPTSTRILPRNTAQGPLPTASGTPFPGSSPTPTNNPPGPGTNPPPGATLTNTPLPTTTGQPSRTPTAPVAATGTPPLGVTVLPTLTPLQTRVPTETPLPTRTPLPTPTNTPFPTDTPLPTNSPLPTDTPIPPSDTPMSPSDTPVQATNTDLPPPPSDTPKPTKTQTPTRTPHRHSVDPFSTPTPIGMGLHSFSGVIG